MSAETSMLSPTQALVGKRPALIVGSGCSMRMRAGGGPGFSSGAEGLAVLGAGDADFLAPAALATAAAEDRFGAGTPESFPHFVGRNVAVQLVHGSGVQLHPTSLPDGRLGPGADEFGDWLAEAGQAVWQMLPLGPPDRHGSPYKARSAFAAWPGLLADPRAEVSPEEIDAFRERHAF